MTQTSLFRNVPTQRTLAAGETLFSTGDDADAMYAVIEGEIEIVRDGKVVETCSADEIFGELAILDRAEDHTRAADARATTDSVVAEINRDRFLFIVKSNPPFALLVMNHLADRIRRGW
ncbi:MAG TPA: cyclic nucleotide-binding domain-containing protein [Ilumatobacteraceae bacterium]|nr:cyclic nucleotide-binding domain-containing protein [Ilumatobacteraceae bacterium]